jgi:hypothetical protein
MSFEEECDQAKKRFAEYVAKMIEEKEQRDIEFAKEALKSWAVFEQNKDIVFSAGVPISIGYYGAKLGKKNSSLTTGLPFISG